MSEFFGTQYSQEDLQQRLAQRRRRNVPSRTSSLSTGQQGPQGNDESMDMAATMDGTTLDDIIMANKEIQRRQSYPHAFLNQEVDRRSSMMEFGPGNSGLNGFQFGQQTLPSPLGSNLRRQSTGELEMGGGFADMGPAMNMNPQQMAYSPPMEGQNSLTINTSSPFQSMSAESLKMFQNMMYTPMTMEGITEEDQNTMSMFSPTFSQPYGNNSMDSMGGNFMMSQNMQDGMLSHRNGISDMDSRMSSLVSDGTMVHSPQNLSMNRSLGPFTSPVTTNMPPTVLNREPPYAMTTPPPPQPQAPPTSMPEPELVVKPEPKPAYQGIYSQSGFDMLGALMKVATRKNPEIDIGKVDMSCAFVVCDITLHDCPIIYVSDIFERLTGYNKHEVKGQNCRFLQSPEGKVEAGAKREFTDNDSVYYLRNRIAEKKEAQRSIINYRKGGQPFMNLLTMIPITGEDDKNIKYFVGFQVDLVEKPTSVEGKNASGTYTVDYSQGSLPRYIWTAPEGGRPPLDGGQTISRDDVSTVLSSINNGTESELTKRMWDKVLLENTDDVVHVLSLKGLFLYLSPSSRHVLEYDASELVGTALSSVCHPSDIVPVTRELKDTSTGAAVNVVFRIRRKRSGYTWFESHGSLCVEQGKGRKCIILVGRERPVYALHRRDLEAAGGLGESEVWTKLSTSGMFLFVSSNIRSLLDRSPEDLIGTSIQGLMRAESRVEFGRCLEKARTGKRVTHKHEILNKRGLVLQAQTTLYPGDASEGQKPTFLVGQTRFLKSSSRAVAPAGSHSSKTMSGMGKGDQAEDSTSLSGPSIVSSSLGQDTPSSSSVAGPITQAGSSGLAIGSQDVALASEDNIFDELKTTRCTSWQFELRQMEKSNRLLAEELAALLSNKKKRKRRKGAGHLQRDCANCHTRVTPEWRRGPSGQRDLCNSCGLRWAKQTGRVSPRTSTRGDKQSQSQSQRSASPQHSSPLQQEVSHSAGPSMPDTPNLNKDDENTDNVKGDGAATLSVLGGSPTSEIKASNGFGEGGHKAIVSVEEDGAALSQS